MERCHVNPQPNLRPSAFGFWRWIPHTRGIKRVEIIRMYPKGTGPNCTYGAVDPMPTRAGFAVAQTLIASVYGRWALPD